MGKLQLLKVKDKKTKDFKYALALNNSIVSRHRTLGTARKKYIKALKIAKG